jgi:hypothetical protein
MSEGRLHGDDDDVGRRQTQQRARDRGLEQPPRTRGERLEGDGLRTQSGRFRYD